MYEAGEAAPVATTLRTLDGVAADDLVRYALAADASLPLSAGGGALTKEMIRVNHYGRAATLDTVRACLTALGSALPGADVGAAEAAAAEAWALAESA